MAKRMSGAGVNRLAARKAAEVAALRRAQREAYEQSVTEAVAVWFDRSGRAEAVRVEARERADRILADAEQAAAALGAQADNAVVRLKTLGERTGEIALMLGLPFSGVRAALTRADSSATPGLAVPHPGSEPGGSARPAGVLAGSVAAAGP